MNLIAELRKRNVFRVLAAYLVVAWAVLQVVDYVANTTQMPAWTDTFVLIVVLLGLPIVIIAAWALELTPEGIKPSGTQAETAARPFGPLDIILSIAVLAVLGLFAWQLFHEQTSKTTQTALPEQSIAVLPFVAFSDDPEDVVLGDGLAEELLNVLAQFPDLLVAGRTSSFAFRDQPDDIQTIGEQLGVSHVLEGSVRRSGDQVRITAQLIRTSDGFHIWSGSYDRQFSDILEVQDEIVRQLARVLTVRLGIGAEAREGAPSANPAAYEQYLRGRVYWSERIDDENRYAALDAFQAAVDIDPDFAQGWGALALALSYSLGYTPSPYLDQLERARQAAQRALALDPNNAEAYVALSEYNKVATRDWDAAEENLQRALELAPNAAFTHYQAGLFYRYLGDADRTIAAYRQAMALDPLNLTTRTGALEFFALLGRESDALRLVENEPAPEAWKLQRKMFIAQLCEDGDLYLTATDELMTLSAATPSTDDDPTPAEENLIALNRASFRGDIDEVRSRIPALEDAAAQHFVDPEDIGFAYDTAGEYEKSAELFLRLVDANPPFEMLLFAPMPDGTRCQAAYHAIWERPGMPELAAIRRANGATENLPLSGSECAPFLRTSE